MPPRHASIKLIDLKPHRSQVSHERAGLSCLVHDSSIPFGDFGCLRPVRSSCSLPQKVIVGDAEVHRTKVVAMTLSPVWDETFFLSPEARSRGAASAGPADPDSDTGGVRFEIWDHDFHGKGDYLGTFRPVVLALRLAGRFILVREAPTNASIFLLCEHIYVCVAYGNDECRTPSLWSRLHGVFGLWVSLC